MFNDAIVKIATILTKHFLYARICFEYFACSILLHSHNSRYVIIIVVVVIIIIQMRKLKHREIK